MAQDAIGTIDPNTTSGTDLATLLTDFDATFHSTNSGTTRPAALLAGGMWLDTTDDPVWKLKVFAGGTVDWVLLTVNKTTGAKTFTGTVSGSGTGNVVSTRAINTGHSLTGGGNLTADRYLTLLNDTASPGNNKVYGTDGTGTRGWFAAQTLPKIVERQEMWPTPGTYSWTCPGDVSYATIVAIAGGSGSVGGEFPNTASRLTGRSHLTPGHTYTVKVGVPGTEVMGGLGGETSLQNKIYAYGNGSASFVNETTGNDLATSYRAENGVIYGDAGVGGLLVITYFQFVAS